MDWVQKINNIRNRATEIINAEVIFIGVNIIYFLLMLNGS